MSAYLEAQQGPQRAGVASWQACGTHGRSKDDVAGEQSAEVKRMTAFEEPAGEG